MHDKAEYLKTLQPDDEGRAVDRDSILKDCPTLDLDDILGPGECNITRKRLKELARLVGLNASDEGAGEALVRFYAALMLWGGENEGDLLVRNLSEALEMPSLAASLRQAAGAVTKYTIANAYYQLGRRSIPGITPRIASAFVHFLWIALHPGTADAGNEVQALQDRNSSNTGTVTAETIVPQIIDLRAMGGVRRFGGDRALWPTFISFQNGDSIYLDYCKCLGKWARELGCSTEQLEYFLRS